MTRRRFEVWRHDCDREDASEIEAVDEESAAEAYADRWDSEDTEGTLCVAEVGSVDVETFDLRAEYYREWDLERWPSPLERFGDAIAEVARWIDDTPRREAEEAEAKAWRERMAAMNERHHALAAFERFCEGVAYALAARNALLGLGIAEEDHERVVTAHFALAQRGEAQR